MESNRFLNAVEDFSDSLTGAPAAAPVAFGMGK